jgi:ATP-dependent RNA helicase DeaD
LRRITGKCVFIINVQRYKQRVSSEYLIFLLHFAFPFKRCKKTKFMTFQELALNESLVRAVTELGYQEATLIQEKAIPILLGGEKDFIGLAQTGTGKTAAFGLPLLHLITPKTKTPQALIVCPTRELCLQIVNELENFKKHLPGIKVVAVYGGSSIGVQIRDLKSGVQIVVATPGRLIDLIERKAIKLEEIKYVVLDEADEMLNMGFEEDIEFILKNTVNRDSMWLFSATMPPQIRKVIKRYMNAPTEVEVGKVNTGNKNIDHQYYITQASHKYDALKRLIDFNPGMYGIIFTRTKMDAQKIAAKLTNEGYQIDALHGDLSQEQRNKVMSAFREKALTLLIATDVAARGIDVKEVSHVINFDLPDDLEVYTHRSGRTGRAGNTGICMSIVNSREIGKIRMIERMVQAKFHKNEIPLAKDVTRKQFYSFIDKLQNADISHGDYELFVPIIEEKFADITKEELIQRFASLEFDRFLKYYANAEDLNIAIRDERRSPRDFRNERGNTRDSRNGSVRRNDNRSAEGGRTDTAGRTFKGGAGYSKVFMNIGTKDGMYKAGFLQYILDGSGLKKESIGRIDLRDILAWVEVDQGQAKNFIKSFNGKNYNGRKVRCNEA